MKVHKKMIIIASGILFVLNLFDGLMTYWGLSLKVIEEGNPLMQILIAKYPSWVMSIKLVLPLFLGLSWFAREQSLRFIMYSLSLLLVVYFVTDIFHVYWWLKIK